VMLAVSYCVCETNPRLAYGEITMRGTRSYQPPQSSHVTKIAVSCQSSTVFLGVMTFRAQSGRGGCVARQHRTTGFRRSRSYRSLGHSSATSAQRCRVRHRAFLGRRTAWPCPCRGWDRMASRTSTVVADDELQFHCESEGFSAANGEVPAIR